MPGFHDLAYYLLEADRDIPARVVRPHFPQIAVVADMVPNAVIRHVSMSLGLVGETLDQGKGLEDTAGVRLSPAEIVDLTAARVLRELVNEAGNVVAMNVVPDLFAFVTVDPVLAVLKVALHEVA